MTATPRPWQIIVDEDSPLGCIFSPGSETVICTMTPNGQNDLQVKHDAELIVHAVNTFDEAKAALEQSNAILLWYLLHYGNAGAAEYRVSENKAVLARMSGSKEYI